MNVRLLFVILLRLNKGSRGKRNKLRWEQNKVWEGLRD